MFDRGRQPKEIIDFILANKDKFILIRGNHKDLMEDMIARNKNTFGNLSNGTAQTIVDLYPKWQISEFDLKKISTETRLQDVLDLCIDYFETEHYIFVHGWIPIIENCCLYDAEWRTIKSMSQIKQLFADIGIAVPYGMNKIRNFMTNLEKMKTLNLS